MKKIFSVLMLLTLIIFATPAQAQTDFNFGGKLIPFTTFRIWECRVVDNIDFLALRSGPSVNYRMLTKIPPGAYITITTAKSFPYQGYSDVDQNFVEVSYKGIDGWAHSRYIIKIKLLR